MKEILEKLDLSEEVKTELSESFDAAVKAKALEIAESKSDEYEQYVSDYLEESRADLESKLDEYLERVVEEFVTENEAKLDEAAAGKQYETVLEGFNSVLVAAGVQIAQIAEAKEDADVKLGESTQKAVEIESAKVDALMEEVMELKATNAELLKTGLVKESMEDMTDVQKEKFMKLASVVEFDAKAPEAYITKLDTIAESVKGEKAAKEDVVESVKKVITESAVKTKTVPVARHLW